MLIYLRVLKESLGFALNALKNNKLRTFLSLLGVTIGIFSIIAVLAAVDSLKKEIEGSISSLDNSTIFLGHFSFGPTDVPRWKWRQFPTATYEEYQHLKRNMPDVEAISYTLNVQNETIKYEDKSVENVNIGAITHEYYDIEDLKIQEGRFFNELESNNGTKVMVLRNPAHHVDRIFEPLLLQDAHGSGLQLLDLVEQSVCLGDLLSVLSFPQRQRDVTLLVALEGRRGCTHADFEHHAFPTHGAASARGQVPVKGLLSAASTSSR